MKYWQGVNFDDWQFLDKSPTFNPPIIVHMYRFYCVMLRTQNGIAAVFKRTDKPKVPLPSKLNLNSLSECQLQQVNDHVRKLWETKLVQVEWERNAITTSIRLRRKGRYRHTSFNTWYPRMQLSTTYVSIPMSQHQMCMLKLALLCTCKI